MRAGTEGSIGKVTTEISQRSASRMRRTPLFGSERAFTVRKPIDSPSSAPDFISEKTSAARQQSPVKKRLAASRRLFGNR